jgi:hypothetical protein
MTARPATNIGRRVPAQPISLLGNGPGGGDHPETERRVRAVGGHLADRHGTVGVAPKDVGVTVTVDVANSDDLVNAATFQSRKSDSSGKQLRTNLATPRDVH